MFLWQIEPVRDTISNWQEYLVLVVRHQHYPVAQHNEKQSTSSTNFHNCTRQLEKLKYFVLLTKCPNSEIITDIAAVNKSPGIAVNKLR